MLGGLRTKLSDLGDVDLEKLCRDAASHPLMQNNPVPMDESALLPVLGFDVRSIALRPTDLFFLLSALCVTANAFIIKTVQSKYRQTADTISYYNNFVVLLLFALFAVFRGDLRSLHASETPGFRWLVLLGGLAQTGIYFFYYRNLKRHEVWVVKLWLLLMPVVSLIIGILFLKERITVWKLVGIGVVLLGACLILLRSKLHPNPVGKEIDHAKG